MDHQILLSQKSLVSLKNAFINALHNASVGQKSSIAFIKNPLQISTYEYFTCFQSLCVGGSIFEVADVHIRNGKIELKNYSKKPLPVIKDKDTLFKLISGVVSQDTQLVGMNFAYPLQPVIRDSVLDGVLLRGTKEHTFTGLVNKQVGKEIENYFLETEKKKITCVVANDTVCLVLAGLQKYKWKELVGGIVGTGTNFGFFLDKGTVVNLESGNFNDFVHSESLGYVDAISGNKGQQLFEKEVAGGYLYQHYNYYIRKFRIHSPEVASTEMLNEIAETTTHPGYTIACELLERSASMIAAQIVALHTFKKNKLCIVMEGSLYWKGHHYKEWVDEYVHRLGVPSSSISLTKVENSSVHGAAYLAVR
jgi:hexokinase